MFDSFFYVFLALTIAFLAGTAFWYRFDHAISSRRFNDLPEATLVEQVKWQYSLRSNLLLWGCVLAGYLLQIGEVGFLIACFAGFGLLNIVTDHIYRYESVAVFSKVKTGHQIACGVIWAVAIMYWIMVAHGE
jgi:hypothetical protein